MQAYCTLTRRELAGFFLSPTGYIIIAGTLFLVGCSYLDLLLGFAGDTIPMPLTELFPMTLWFWVILLLQAPVITMRLFAQEKFSGTFETLMTTPVSDFQVVAAKFTAAQLFYMVSWLPLLACILVVRHYTGDTMPFDTGAVASTFGGIFLLGCVLVSWGCFASALTKSQMTAAMITLVFSLSLFLLSLATDRFASGDWKSQVIALFALPDQMHDFVRGVVDTRPVVLYLSLTLCFLFLTLRVVESRRWK